MKGEMEYANLQKSLASSEAATTADVKLRSITSDLPEEDWEVANSTTQPYSTTKPNSPKQSTTPKKPDQEPSSTKSDHEAMARE
ncbi:hypothetical protein GCK72_003119 [Caenorhabditis remanei]|uniref:Uncharacterized protein n=1 Tax=Caenorhabditis remanei TaxID=31234 RepID=A0A6A5HXP0_CAERE|nr:hypothetical protein GCK72_003119 [Caenorhabditis remanei]KAF1771293.1 hypothetical protein GCK72_003119 [Caenorhabditis remanei]